MQRDVNPAQRMHHNLAHAVSLHQSLRFEDGGGLRNARWAGARCNHVDAARSKAYSTREIGVWPLLRDLAAQNMRVRTSSCNGALNLE